MRGSQETFCRLKNSVCHSINYVKKTILSDAESHEEHGNLKRLAFL